MRIGLHIPDLGRPDQPAPMPVRLGLSWLDEIARDDPSLERIELPDLGALGRDTLADLDAVLLLDPVGMMASGLPLPAREERGPRIVAILGEVHRLIGDEGRLPDGRDGMALHARLATLRGYDRLLALDDPSRLGLRDPEFVAGGEGLWAALRPRHGDRKQRVHAPATTRLAIVSPWRPDASGVAVHSERLAHALLDRYSIELVHRPGVRPAPSIASGRFGTVPADRFADHERLRGRRALVYHMGNSPAHGFVRDMLAERPGVVTLHDFCLSGFQFWKAHRDPGDPFENLRRLVREHYPDRFEAWEPELRRWTEEPGGFAEALARRELAVNADVLRDATAVVVHSPWCRDRIARDLPDVLDHVAVIPLGATIDPPCPAERAATRAAFGIPDDALLLGCFGFLTPDKLTREAVEALASVASRHPAIRLAFVGADWEGGAAHARAVELGVSDRVRFLGRQPEPTYRQLLGAVDLGLCLRRPPTHGETSAALLDLLRRGVPTITTDAGTFGDVPDDVACRIHWDDDGVAALAGAIDRLASDPDARASLGRNAIEHVDGHHHWSRVADLYAAVIDRVANVEPSRPVIPSRGIAKTHAPRPAGAISREESR